MSVKRQVKDQSAVTEVKRDRGKTRRDTKRHRHLDYGHPGTPGETGVRRPDGRKPEACEGAGPGSGGVTGNPVIRRETHERQLGEGTVLGSKRCGYDIHGPGVTP